MKNTIKRVATIATTFITAASMLMAVNAACTYKTLTYTTGTTDNVVGITEVSFDKIIDTTFDTAAASRFSRKGYTLSSWSIPSTGETVGLGAQYKMPANDITFVANWKAAEYNVSFAGKGGKTIDGKANITGIKATFGTPMELPMCEFYYDGYQFAGWKYNNTVYNVGDEFEVPALLSGSKIVFAATWVEEEEIIEEEEVVEEEIVEEAIEETTEETVEEEIVEETINVEIKEVIEETIYEEAVNEEIIIPDSENVFEEEEEIEITEEEILTEGCIYIAENPYDYNNDGVVDINDANALRKFIVGSMVEGFEVTIENADINNDGIVNVFDYISLVRICQ